MLRLTSLPDKEIKVTPTTKPTLLHWYNVLPTDAPAAPWLAVYIDNW